jgi:hypothetical protein
MYTRTRARATPGWEGVRDGTRGRRARLCRLCDNFDRRRARLLLENLYLVRVSMRRPRVAELHVAAGRRRAFEDS